MILRHYNIVKLVEKNSTISRPSPALSSVKLKSADPLELIGSSLKGFD